MENQCRVNEPGLGEEMNASGASEPSSVPCLDHLRTFLAASFRLSSCRPCVGGRADRFFGRHSTINSELARTRGIRLSN
ncbi:hypothetical protein GE061_020211 [Apolygus lucorum]|uniref:Uncharacterized protein n=1 Tax=Apolygus lucorum TaxID=248454 RepID=A0A6A4K661_APOLU|nr:hypothetical protein GE061_020205 [Apolygus lucorum]KAF6197456.1 hypothetical protein GE061_020211 [Apolygus lucorum]